MQTKEITRLWFEIWESGDFERIPISESFTHTSPYGTIKGRKEYMKIIEANKDKFLGNQFILHDELYEENKACVRYTAINGDFRLEVSEWHYVKNGLLEHVEAYYNIEGEISEQRKLKDL